MIDFTKKGISSILDVKSVDVGYFDNDDFHFVMTLDKSQFDIYACDIVYYKKQGNGYFIKRADDKGHIRNGVLDNCGPCKKHIHGIMKMSVGLLSL